MDEAPVGFEVDDARGGKVGTVHGSYVDAKSGETAWLIVAIGRRRPKLVAVPASESAAAGGRVWVAQDGEALRSAPGIDPTRPLLREHELTICEHYGIGERIGRAAEVAARPQGELTARPGA
jgi:hypothetical protein